MSERRKFTPEERKAVYDKFGGHCAYCGKDITLKEMQIDHVFPVRKWLGSNGVNNMRNLFPACKSCNHYKSTFDLEQFREQIGNIPEVLRRDKATFRIAERYGLIDSHKKKVVFYFETLEGME